MKMELYFRGKEKKKLVKRRHILNGRKINKSLTNLFTKDKKKITIR